MYDWEFPKEELTFSSGIIPALYQFVEDLVKDDEKVLMTTPSYGFFQHAAEYSGKEYVCSSFAGMKTIPIPSILMILPEKRQILR